MENLRETPSGSHSEVETELIHQLQCKSYSKIQDILTNNENFAVWDIILDDQKTYLHLISQTKLPNSILKEESPTEAEKFVNFIKYFLGYLESKLPKEKYIEYLNKGTKQGYTALHYAAYYGNIYLILYLIEKGADIKKTNNAGMTVLHTAAQGNQTTILAYLKEMQNFKVNDTDNEKSTPLHWACFMGAISAANFLVLSGANVNALDTKGNSPLHMATDGAKIKIFRILLQNGANPKIFNTNNKTPLDLANEKKNNLKIRTMLYKGEYGQGICDCTAPLKKIEPSNTNKIMFFIMHIVLLLVTLFLIFPLIHTILKVIYLLFLGLLFLVFFFLLCVNPWESRQYTRSQFYSSNFSKEKILEGRQIINIEDYCPICLLKTKDSPVVHCFICNRCSTNFDHHCYWINKDISYKNFTLFMELLVLCLLFSIFTLVINLLLAIKTIHNQKVPGCETDKFSDTLCFGGYLQKDGFKWVYVIILLALSLFIFIYFIFIAILSYIHFKGICANYCKSNDVTRSRNVSLYMAPGKTPLLNEKVSDMSIS